MTFNCQIQFAVQLVLVTMGGGPSKSKSSDAEKRQNICKLCILVKGFSKEINFNIIKQHFPKTFRGKLLIRSANFEPREKKWIVQCQSVEDVQEYIAMKVLKTPNGILDTSACYLPSDVPEEWLQAFDSPNVPIQARPPAYSDIYLGGDHDFAALNTQHPPLGQYDPRLIQQPGQYPYQGYGMQWPSYKQDSAVQNISSPERNRPVDFTSDAPSNQLAEDVTMDSFSNNNSPENDMEDQVEESKKNTTTMLKVTKLPPYTTEDTLENFFENTRKYGGGDVEQVDYDEETNAAIITFVEEGAVEKVLQKRPILFNKKIIEVEAYFVNVEPPIEVSREEFYDCGASSQESEVSCTIEVRGMKPSTSEDTILYYFESKKGALADVEEIEFVEDKNMYLLTFEDDTAVDRALSKSHVVDGVQLQVKKHVPPKRYPNKVLVKGLSEKTSKDSLTNYLEARTRKDIVSVDFGHADSQKAIVTFTESIDISEIQTTCKKKALDGCFLTIHPVFLTNCIIVRGYSEKTTENALEFYFDNKRKSGVDGVSDIQMNTNEDYCLIYFEDPKDALVACQRSHVINTCKLQVQVFYDCLGIPAEDEGPKERDVIMPGIDDPVELKSLLKQGGTYKSYGNRIYLAGACSAGKTTLASLLIGDEIPLEWKSTDGLKIFFGRNGIHLEELKMVPLGKDKENQNILSNVLRGQPKIDKSKTDMAKGQADVDTGQQKIVKGQSEDCFSMSTSVHAFSQQAVPVSFGTRSGQSGPMAAGKVHSMSRVPENQELTDENIKMQYNDKSMQKRLGYTLMQEGIKQELKRGEYKVKIAPSDLVDFGGQKSYDMTHQLFIQGKGTFTLIFDVRKGLRDPLNEYPQGDVTTESILKHWVDSILTYCGEDDDDILPIILFVATHRDRLPEDKQSKVMTEFKQGLTEMFYNHERKHRIKYDDIFFINGRDGSYPEVLRLQTSYVNIAVKQKSWGRKMPLAWVPLELQIMEMRSNNINIISKDDLVKINAENDDLELTSKQLNDFLRSQHLLGNIMYFESQGLEKFIILQPTFLVDILRSFITDQMFFPSDSTLRQILNEMIMTGKIRKQDLFKLWNQDEFNQHMPDDNFKQYVTKVLVHLDFLVEPKHYNTRESTRDFYLVPCAVNRKPATDFIQQLDNNKTICLSYKLLKSSIPSALSFKLIGAAINIWPLKETEQGVVCLYHKAAVLCIDNINTMYLSVQNDRIMVYLTNETSNYFIPPDIASCVQECLTLTLTTSLEFYHSSFGKVVSKVTIAKLFEIEVVQKCGTEICYISLTDISRKKPPWKCSLGREHTTEFPMYWTYKKECGTDCKGLDEQCLILCPEDKHLARLARHIGMSTFDLFVITLGLSRVVWEDFEYKYHGRDPLMLKHDILCRWKKSTDKPRSFEDLRTALKKNGYDQHILCQIFREDRAILDLKDNILQEVPDNDTLLELSGQLINCAIHLGVELGIDFCHIAETMEKYNKEMSKQNYDILMKWKNSRNSQNKTIRYLMHVIKIVFPGACTFLQKKYHIAS